MPDQIAVQVHNTMGNWSISSSGSVDVTGTIVLTPPATGAWVTFSVAVKKGADSPSTGPYYLSTVTLLYPTAAGTNNISAGPAQNGPWCTAHPISINRGGTGGS